MKEIIKDKIIYLYVVLFFILSLLSISKASIFFNPSTNINYKQIIWYLIGIVFILIIKRINIKKLYNASIIIYIFNVLLLIFLIFFGEKINGSKCWLNVLGLNIQPSEFMKISLIIINSYTIYKFYKNKDKINTKKEFKLIMTIFILLIIPSILTFLEPDTGSVIGYFIISFSMLYISGINRKWILLFIIIILIISSSFIFLYFYKQDLLINIFGSNIIYRMERIINWNSKSGMQLNNSLISIGSSGLFGNGNIPIYYPESETDFIFTSYLSSFGLLYGLVLLLIIISFDLWVLNLIKNISNKEDKYTLFGIISIFIYQQIQNIGMTLGLLPIMGITLPLISYGGSSIISFLILIGLISNIKKTYYK